MEAGILGIEKKENRDSVSFASNLDLCVAEKSRNGPGACCN